MRLLTFSSKKPYIPCLSNPKAFSKYGYVFGRKAHPAECPFPASWLPAMRKFPASWLPARSQFPASWLLAESQFPAFGSLRGVSFLRHGSRRGSNSSIFAPYKESISCLGLPCIESTSYVVAICRKSILNSYQARADIKHKGPCSHNQFFG